MKILVLLLNVSYYKTKTKKNTDTLPHTKKLLFFLYPNISLLNSCVSPNSNKYTEKKKKNTFASRI